MSLQGSLQGRLTSGLHAEACSQATISTRCWPVVVETGPAPDENKIEVVYCEWCAECGAADWEVV